MGRRKCILVIWGKIARVRDIWESPEWTSPDRAGNEIGKEGGGKEPRSLAMFFSQEAKVQIEWVTKISELYRKELLREG